MTTCITKFMAKTQQNVRLPKSDVDEAKRRGVSVTDACARGLRETLGFITPNEALNMTLELLMVLDDESFPQSEKNYWLARARRLVTGVKDGGQERKTLVGCWLEELQEARATHHLATLGSQPEAGAGERKV